MEKSNQDISFGVKGGNAATVKEEEDKGLE
jgi:hypothetical protein